MYLHVVWEAGTRRCHQVLPVHSGANYGFDGGADEFECMVRDAKGRTVTSVSVPLKDVMGRSGRIAWFRGLVSHELESIDGDLP